MLEIESNGGEPFLHVRADNTSATNYPSHSRIFTTIDEKGTTQSIEIYKNPDLYRWLLLHQRGSEAGVR